MDLSSLHQLSRRQLVLLKVYSTGFMAMVVVDEVGAMFLIAGFVAAIGIKAV
ncbi:hypothetical protein [Anabaena sp. CCY 9402-a]|uniref:hypothetical protein n=1 Tax=Anabaena sp. CCY 9402-a TaxID=3103867 RepID=UPI0039C7616A